MELGSTSDTGWIGDARALAGELRENAVAFRERTAGIEGELFVCLRSLPEEYERRSFSRYERGDGVLYLDLAVTEEEIADLSIDEQRALIGVRLRDLAARGLRSRVAPWSRSERTAIATAFDEYLSLLGWSADTDRV